MKAKQGNGNKKNRSGKLKKRLKKGALILSAVAGSMAITSGKATQKVKPKSKKNKTEQVEEAGDLTNHHVYVKVLSDPTQIGSDATAYVVTEKPAANKTIKLNTKTGKAAKPRRKTNPEQVLAERLESLSSDIDMRGNQYVKKHIDNYVVANKNRVSILLKRSESYFPMVDKVFKKYGIPEQLKNLAVVESELKPQARSHMGAAGLWQIMPATGRELGLKVNRKNDQRNDPYLATEAAAKYFNNLYDIYGDWLLVIAAYNCGPGNVNKAIRKSGGQKNFWAIRQYLPKETQNYVPKFIAASYAMNFHAQHNITTAA